MLPNIPKLKEVAGLLPLQDSTAEESSGVDETSDADLGTLLGEGNTSVKNMTCKNRTKEWGWDAGQGWEAEKKSEAIPVGLAGR